PSGYYSFTTQSERPSNFTWSNIKNSGSSYNLTAQEWNSFTNRINQFRNYKSMSSYSFSTAQQNGLFLASFFNEARSAISGMSPSISLPQSKNSGDSVNASDLNRLVEALNSIS